VKVIAVEGEPLAAEWSVVDHPDVSVTVKSLALLGRAENRSLSVESLRGQFGRLGKTPYELAGVTLDVEGAPFAPASLLNQLRREAVEQLQSLQGRPRHVTVNDPSAAVSAALMQTSAEAQDENAPPELHLLVRTPEQLEAALVLGPASITLDYLDLYGLRPSVERIKSGGLVARVASPRVLKPGEGCIVDFLLSLDCAILLRSAGILHGLRGREHPPLVGDFSLNAANVLTARTYLELGLSRLTPTHDLNAEQVAGLARSAGAERIETVVYQHLPVFHTEHCVFCRFLSNGTSYRDCGRPCEKHRVALKDPSGRAHPVMADVGCRNTVFGAEAQEASRHLDIWRRAGIRHFRLEFVHESAGDVRRIVRAFQRSLAGATPPAQLAAELKSIAPEGTTEGSLFVPDGYVSLPVLQ
jgi:U32 family peptidase